MSNLALDLVGMVVGCALAIAIIVIALTYRDVKLKKELAAKSYRCDKERPERSCGATTGQEEPKFGQGYFAFIVTRDIAEADRQIEKQRNDKTG